MVVERYNYSEGDECMREDVHGAYVGYDDYDALESENARLKEALRELTQRSYKLAQWAFEKNNGVPLVIGAPVLSAVHTAREVLGDAALR